MSITLHLGVADVPYVIYQSGKRKRKATATGLTTGDVAEILEAKYHVMEVFFHVHDKEIVADLEEGLKGALESILTGAPISFDPFGEGTSAIEARFKKFLAEREMERLGYQGVPTKAALEGINHRFKHPYAKRNPRRPSFIDTGQYQASMKAWVD